MASFSSVVIVWIYVFVCVYMYIHMYIPKYNLLCPFKVTSVYAFRTGHLALNNYWCALPRGGPSRPLPALLSCCSSLCSLEASWAFPHPVWHDCWCPCLFLFISRLDSWWDIASRVSDVTRRHNLTSEPLILTLKIFHPVFCNFLSVGWGSVL